MWYNSMQMRMIIVQAHKHTHTTDYSLVLVPKT